MKSAIFTFLAAVSAPAFAGFSLAADDAPSDPPWKAPATIAYVWNGDGTATGTIDAVLKYQSDANTKNKETTGVASGASSWSAYIHRDTNSSAPRDDRGLAFSYGQQIVPDTPGDGPVLSFNWKAKVALGKSLQVADEKAATPSYFDATKDRETLMLHGYYQPAFPKTATPAVPDSKDKPPMIMFFDWSAGVYSDNGSGGDSTSNGRRSGGLLSFSANFAPLGQELTPSPSGAIGYVPTIKLAAQVERDASSTNGLQSATYTLYSVEFTVRFGHVKKGQKGLVPSINLTRTVGADLLAGRPDSTKTELSLGFTF